jgi:hypothetical protein
MVYLRISVLSSGLGPWVYPPACCLCLAPADSKAEDTGFSEVRQITFKGNPLQ